MYKCTPGRVNDLKVLHYGEKIKAGANEGPAFAEATIVHDPREKLGPKTHIECQFKVYLGFIRLARKRL